MQPVLCCLLYLEIRKGVFDFAAAAEEAGDYQTFLEVDKEPTLCSVFGIPPNLFDNAKDGGRTLLPLIIVTEEDRNVSYPYAPNQADILAKDWYII